MTNHLANLLTQSEIIRFEVVSAQRVDYQYKISSLDLYDNSSRREIDFATAMTASVQAVTLNPLPMAVWAAIIGIGLFASIITVFLALPLVLPVLGHGTWHMYRKVVASVSQPAAERL